MTSKFSASKESEDTLICWAKKNKYRRTWIAERRRERGTQHKITFWGAEIA